MIFLFTGPTAFDTGDEFVQPTKWRVIGLPNYMLNMLLDVAMPNPMNETEYQQECSRIKKIKMRWLSELHRQGYTAVRVCVNSEDAIVVQGTKEIL